MQVDHLVLRSFQTCRARRNYCSWSGFSSHFTKLWIVLLATALLQSLDPAWAGGYRENCLLVDSLLVCDSRMDKPTEYRRPKQGGVRPAAPQDSGCAITPLQTPRLTKKAETKRRANVENAHADCPDQRCWFAGCYRRVGQ
jgi:hypothetical protein